MTAKAHSTTGRRHAALQQGWTADTLADHAAAPTFKRNDNRGNARPPQRYAFDIYRAAARARWIGQVIATSTGEAIEAAAIAFNTHAWKLIAVQRFEIAG